MNQKIYERLAKKYAVSVEDIKRDMQEAIEITYTQPTKGVQNIKREGDIATIDEFINYVISMIKDEK